jgi:hypothetical protein
MKKLFIICILLILVNTFCCSGQITYNLDVVAKEPKTEQQLIGKSQFTGDFGILRGKTYPVYLSVNNKLFIVYQNSKGNWTKKYLTRKEY